MVVNQCDNVIPFFLVGDNVYNAYLQIEGYFNQNSLMNVPYTGAYICNCRVVS